MLARRHRARVFGSRLTVRLLLRFAALAVVPGLLVYTVSVQFLTSIESWFDVKVDAALEGGINLGQSAIDQMTLELQGKANAMALELADRPPAQLATLLERLRGQLGVEEAVVVTGSGRLLASAARTSPGSCPSCPRARRCARRAPSAATRRSTPPSEARSRCAWWCRWICPGETRFLQLRQTVPPSFAQSAEAVEAAYRDYRELALSRQGLKRIYIVTLTFALLMALFVAIALAATQSGLLAEPLANLAQATQAVARGDFSPPRAGHQPRRARRADRVVQLDDAPARRSAPRRRVEPLALESAKARLENILANLSAGVLVFDHELGLSISNHGAQAILGTDLEAFAAADARPVSPRTATPPGSSSWSSRAPARRCSRAARALPQATGGGSVLVFDDITQLIQAQRATAWAEVARRLAHEIKNPLTPIQLSAERLEMKLAEQARRARTPRR